MWQNVSCIISCCFIVLPFNNHQILNNFNNAWSFLHHINQISPCKGLLTKVLHFSHVLVPYFWLLLEYFEVSFTRVQFVDTLPTSVFNCGAGKASRTLRPVSAFAPVTGSINIGWTDLVTMCSGHCPSEKDVTSNIYCPPTPLCFRHCPMSLMRMYMVDFITYNP